MNLNDTIQLVDSMNMGDGSNTMHMGGMSGKSTMDSGSSGMNMGGGGDNMPMPMPMIMWMMHMTFY